MAENIEEPQWCQHLPSNGDEFKFVMEKTLTESDVKPQQNRLLIPQINVTNHLGPFLYDHERARRIEVTIFIKSGWRFCLKLTTEWKTRSTVINGTEYRKLIIFGEFKEGDTVHMWAFRSGDGKLCFTIDKAPSPEPQEH